MQVSSFVLPEKQTYINFNYSDFHSRPSALPETSVPTSFLSKALGDLSLISIHCDKAASADPLNEPLRAQQVEVRIVSERICKKKKKWIKKEQKLKYTILSLINDNDLEREEEFQV